MGDMNSKGNSLVIVRHETSHVGCATVQLPRDLGVAARNVRMSLCDVPHRLSFSSTRLNYHEAVADLDVLKRWFSLTGKSDASLSQH